MKEKFSIKERIRSFGYALNGFRILVKEEHNARIHFFLSIVVIILGFLFKISALEWVCLCFAIGLVIAMETINSAIEGLADFVSPQKHELIKKIKDLSAFAVLFSAFISVIIGIIIFLPKIINLVSF